MWNKSLTNENVKMVSHTNTFLAKGFEKPSILKKWIFHDFDSLCRKWQKIVKSAWIDLKPPPFDQKPFFFSYKFNVTLSPGVNGVQDIWGQRQKKNQGISKYFAKNLYFLCQVGVLRFHLSSSICVLTSLCSSHLCSC